MGLDGPVLQWDGVKVVERSSQGDETTCHADLTQALLRHRTSIVINCLHGAWECGGRVQGLMDLLGIHYTGAPLRAAVTGMDKLCSRNLITGLGIPMPRYAAPAPGESLPAAVRRAGLVPPLILKPVCGGSSEGVRLLRQPSDLDATCPANYFVEEFIPGREYCVAAFSPDSATPPTLSPPARIHYSGEVFAAHHKEEGTFKVVEAQELVPDTARHICKWTGAIHQALGMAGFSRCDFRVDNQGRPLVLEVNVQPGLAAQSIVPRILGSQTPNRLSKFLQLHLSAVQKKVALCIQGQGTEKFESAAY